MARVPRISDAEWEVMNVVWESYPIAANDVVERLAARRWQPNTVKTMLNRLVKKGALGFEAEGNRYLYLPRVSRKACVARETHSFVERVFGGDPASLLVHFARQRAISADDIAELKRILAAPGKKRPPSDRKP
ncbi:MAG TPA: BlaI/MecI/CopY family transcriptional regulator [Pirellulales bacterium]|nr:BlaI/MecI/CopY family transcriptional regulator [Pirellulales bacterium]